jgi:hypothetical protein
MTATWPFEPDSQPVEVLEWMTDVIRCRSAEQRLAMRTIPRVEYEYAYTMDDATYGRAKELARDIGEEDFYLPVWHEGTEVGAVASGETTLPIIGGEQCYASGSKLIVLDDDMNWEICTVLTIGVSTITINPGTVRAYSNAIVTPIRTVSFMQEFEVTRGAKDWQTAKARFLAVKTEDLSAGSGLSYVTYRGFPCITTPTYLLGGDLGEMHGNDADTFDSETGLLFRWPIVSWSRALSRISWNPKTAAELYDLRVWLHQMKGRQKAFWVSSWSADIAITATVGAADTQIEIAAIDFATYFPTVSDFAIVLTDGTVYGIHVTSVAEGDPGKELLTISDAIGTEVTVPEIAKTCRLILSRFDTDRVEIRHGLAASATVSMPTVEVPT